MESLDPAAGNIADALDVIAAVQPTAPLLHLSGRPALTFGSLREQIALVRESLRRQGFAPGDIIAGCVDSRPQMALACLSFPAASTFAPLSPALSEEAYSTLLARLRPQAVLVGVPVDHPLRAAASSRGIAEIRIAADPAAGGGRFVIIPGAAVDRDADRPAARANLAYVLVTSGTTGQAKLVPVGHRQMLAFARTMIDWLRFTPEDIGCALSPFHLAGGLRATLLIPVLGGGAVICLDEADTEGFFRAVDEFRPTYLSAGFAIHRALLRRCDDFPEQIARSRLRFLRTSAGRLEPDEIERLEAIFGAPMVVGLGSTEACGIAHDPLPPHRRKRGAVGIATANEVAVIDASGSFGARGAVGEIVVRGPLVFDGYLDDPELTARSFVGDWFRTGDLGRIDEDGYVFLGGRISELINRGGEKISPVEVDSVLESLPGIVEAAAFGVAHPSLGEELVAAVVRSAGAAIEEADVIDHVRRRMGSRQTPRRIYFVERLPRTDSGKVRRNALAQELGYDADGAPHAGATSARAAGSPLEAALARLWSTALRGRAAGRDDNFFLLGGDSLSGAQLLLRVNAAFGVELQIKDLFGEAATIAGMARAIAGNRPHSPAGESPSSAASTS